MNDTQPRTRVPVMLLLWLLMWSIGITGCALPQYAEHYIYEKDGVVVADGWRYAGDAESPVDKLHINLHSSPIFDIRLPDGVWVSSKKITPAKLEQHGLEVLKIGETEHAIWHPAFSPGALVGRHAYMDFHSSGKWLQLGACGWTIMELLRTPDGKCAFGFPAKLKDLQCLFGPPSKVEKIGIVTGLSCF